MTEDRPDGGNDREGQPTLFGDLDEFTSWRKEWRSMPEFVSEDLSPWKSISVHFACRSDMDRFSKLIDQRLTERTQSVWFPEAEIGRYADKRYADEP